MGNDITGGYVSACCSAAVTQGQRMNGQMFDQCMKCLSACEVKFQVDPPAETTATDAQPTPAVPDAPERMHDKDGGSENAPQVNFDALAQEFKDVSDKIVEHPPDCSCADCRRFAELSDTVLSQPKAFERYQALRAGASTAWTQADVGKQIALCITCANPAEATLLTNPPVDKCFNCAILEAMKINCGLCHRHPVEAIVRALAEGGQQGTIGVCIQCLIKKHSAMRN